MKLPFGVVDADGHINEPEDKIREYIEGPYSAWKKRIQLGSFFDNTQGGQLGSHGGPGFPTTKEWLKAADDGGMEIIHLFPTTLLAYSTITDPDYLVAVGKAYNNYVYDNWLKASPRFKSVALMPLLDVEESVKEMRRTFTELGYNGVFVAATGFGLLGDKKFDPFWAEAEKLGCPIAIHGGHATAESVRYTKFIQRHTIGFPVSNMMQMMHLCYEGTFEKFPNLKVAFLESGCTWVPYLLDRMDEEWGKRGKWDAPNCKEKPSDYIKSDRVFIHAEAAEQLIPEVIRVLGRNRLVYASDWPHWDNEYPESIEEIWERKDLTAKDKKALLRDNALEFYGSGK